MDTTMTLLVALLGYLIGAISFPRLVAHFASPKADIDHVQISDSGGYSLRPSSMGATTVSAALGWKVGCTASLLDMLKVFFPALVLRLLYIEEPYFLIYAFAAVIGNNWPVYYHFKGGWGVSAIYGGLFAVDPLGALVTAFASFVAGFLLRDFMILFYASIILMIPWLWLTTYDWRYILYIVGVNVAVLIKLWPETSQYLRSPKLARIHDGSLASQVPMGRGLIKMMDMMGLNKKH